MAELILTLETSDTAAQHNKKFRGKASQALLILKAHTSYKTSFTGYTHATLGHKTK
jgi:hypothetical protein